VRIDPGSFQMGSPEDEQGRDTDEKRHPAKLTRAFWLKKTEVTQREWKAVMGNEPWSFKACGEDCPVERVNWFEAVAWLNALSRREGLPQCYEMSDCSGTIGAGCRVEDDPACSVYKCSEVSFVGPACSGYRLPTETEWEYAARAGTETALFTGPLEIVGEHHGPALDPIATYGGNSEATYAGAFGCGSWADKQFPATKCGPRPVGTKRANPWGLHDMLGSISERTEDAFQPYPDTALDSVELLGDKRVLRGGSWTSEARYLRAAFRLTSPPQVRSNAFGFRPARTIP
jgi:formylglycine-generating enzyme required for sulfatase activity